MGLYIFIFTYANATVIAMHNGNISVKDNIKVKSTKGVES